MAAKPKPAPRKTLRLLSANIQAGSSTRAYREYVTRSWSHVLPNGKRLNLDSLATLAEPFDLVGLQESDPGSLRSGFTNQADYLAERGGFPFWSHQPNRRISRIAGSGNALLSRLEPTELLDYALPGRIAGRGVLLARFGEGDAAWDLAVTHLSLGAKSRQLQLGFLADLLSESPRLVLMGDFNCDFDAPEMRALYRETRLEPPSERVATFPSWAPRRCLDHVLVGGLKITNYQAIPAAGSDHMAVAVELEVPGGTGSKGQSV
ncbi:MAG TPA: endonuclease/exonuclease/phosphatase family protein [Arenimonas sp.]|uniref:endonuclease/exonuclease/phosphatase family protein n=1 Tax=Arenimonas sp. TaxID=1872635 RepID=UPI002D802F90|nr:endonuclease/exonuclease/phosphatase family protein [Arenimonas sp.]HEU0154330.1 endonuclease/exonuclease/phosphatase family protein [Arenimonas sp.]